MQIRYPCPACGASNTIRPEAGRGLSASPCRACQARLTLTAADHLAPDRPVTRCLVCGDDKLYLQKDLGQGVGCLIIGIGAVLVPWTYGLSLAACALIDYLLYRRLATITVCYVCSSRYRGFPPSPDHTPYDLVTAQTYEARGINWRRRHQTSG